MPTVRLPPRPKRSLVAGAVESVCIEKFGSRNVRRHLDSRVEADAPLVWVERAARSSLLPFWLKASRIKTSYELTVRIDESLSGFELVSDGPGVASQYEVLRSAVAALIKWKKYDPSLQTAVDAELDRQAHL